jgi:phosphatidylethanolamine/phosphatidyl-N-methylethanolamine N-methyltransferase
MHRGRMGDTQIMALFDNERERSETLGGGDAATRALSVTVVENDFVERVYEKLASVYDLVFGPTLHPGRLEAIRMMDIQSEDSVLEVGVGTGINLSLYPSSCQVTGIDLSTSMLEKAHERIVDKGLRNCRVAPMDAAAMNLPDESFDIVYAPYLISVVPDPVKVAQEMRRVCRKGGRIVILNHFKSQNRFLSRIETMISPLTVHIGFKSDLDLDGFLTQANLTPQSIEKVNLFRMWTLATCVK